MGIVIANRQRTKRIEARQLTAMVRALFSELELDEAASELEINLVGLRTMARVNWDFLQHEGPTDVITFDHRDSDAPAGNHQIYGELFICLDVAAGQAREFGTTWQSELVRYVVHGVLHLLGYDDLEPELRRTMKREENRLVRRLEKQFSPKMF
jgi:probable rRNA maturation factor